MPRGCWQPKECQHPKRCKCVYGHVLIWPSGYCSGITGHFIMLVSIIMFVLYFQVPNVAAMFTNKGSTLGLTLSQPFRLYPWHAYVPPGAGPWPMPGVHQVAAPCTALSRGSFMLLTPLSFSHSINMVEHTVLGGQQKVTLFLYLPYIVRRSDIFQVLFHLMTWSTLNLWWVLNLVIPV